MDSEFPGTGNALPDWPKKPIKRPRLGTSLSQGTPKKTKQGNKLEDEDEQSLVGFAIMTFTQDPFKIKKLLTKSDVDGNSRLLLKNDCVEQHILPYMDEIQAQLCRKIDGVSFRVFDVDDDSLHQVRLKKWEKTGYFVLTGGWIPNFVKRKNLEVGDQIGLAMFGGRLFFKLFKKKEDY